MTSWVAGGGCAHRDSKTNRKSVHDLLEREGKETRERGEGKRRGRGKGEERRERGDGKRG